MDNIYDRIGYIGWTEDAATLATAVTNLPSLQRTQYVWCPDGETVSAEQAQSAGVTVVATAAELTDLCKVLVLTRGSNPKALETLRKTMQPCSACADFSDVLPTEKYQRAVAWETAGGFYVDVAAEMPIAQMIEQGEKGRFYYSGRCAQLVYRSFYRLLFPIYVPGEAGEATLLRMLRTTPVGTLSEMLGYIEHYRKTCPAPRMPKLIADQPENAGVANVIKRAGQMTDALWQPVKKFPKVIGLRETDDFSPEIPVVGMPYSSARMGERYIGPNVSFESFFNALEDENSVLYTRDIRQQGNAAAFYGTVCSVLVGNAIALYTRVPAKLWPTIPGMHLIEPNSVESMKLGDTLLNAGHVAIVTGIDRTADGKVYQVYVSESTHPVCRRKVWRADELTTLWLEASGFRIYRYDGIKDVVYEPCPNIPMEGENAEPDRNGDLAMNYGNKTNCHMGEELTFHIKTKGWQTLRIDLDGKTVCELPLTGAEQLCTYMPANSGYYTAICTKRDGAASKAVEFAVVNCSVSIDQAVYTLGESVIATGNDLSGAVPECAFLIYDGVMNDKVRETQHIQWFTPEEQAAGKGAVYYDVPGPYMLKLFFRNQYGVYCSDYVKLEIEEGL